ncbi:MAG: hypothetical protein LC715_08800 [Gammaproteobacteria bacterium]|nr:hypothetical protein [Gammaproteobacteria bacterium]
MARGINADEMQMLGGGEGRGEPNTARGDRADRPARPAAGSRRDAPAQGPAQASEFKDDFADDDIPF